MALMMRGHTSVEKVAHPFDEEQTRAGDGARGGAAVLVGEMVGGPPSPAGGAVP